jgi:hypothetical protein
MNLRIIRKGTIWKYKNRTGAATIVKVIFVHTIASVTWVAFMPIHRDRLGGVMTREDFCDTFEWMSSK